MGVHNVPKDAIKQGIEMLRAGQPAEARSLCKGVLRDCPGHPDAMHLLGVIEHNAGHFDVAVRLMESAVSQRPGEAAFHNNLGVSYVKLGRLDSAMSSFLRSVSANPQCETYLKNLGSVAVRFRAEKESKGTTVNSDTHVKVQSILAKARVAGAQYIRSDNDLETLDALDFVFDKWE